MDKKAELKGLLAEVVKEELGSKVDEVAAKAEAAREASAQALESNTGLKDQFDAWQDKAFSMKGNAGGGDYVFKGYDVNHPARNWHAVMPKAMHDEVSETIKKALTTGNTGAYAVPVEYGNALMGLAELQSFALANCRVIRFPGEVMYMPSKGTRATTDAQAWGTANAAAATALARLTFTIDKRVGDYEEVYDNVLRQANFDVVGQFVEPLMAESIGQRFDGYMFNTSSEFTTTIIGNGTSGATFSGTIGSSSITYSGLMDVEMTPETERNVKPVWCMPRGVWKYVIKLVDTNGQRIFQKTQSEGHPYELDGYPVHIVPAISASPANGALCMAFGDPSRYIIAVNQDMIFEVNPWVSRKEGITQFIMHATADGNIEAATAWSYYKRNDA